MFPAEQRPGPKQPTSHQTRVGVVLIIALLTVACSESTTRTPQADPQRTITIKNFEEAVDGDGSCRRLFVLRDRLEPGDAYIESDMVPAMQRLGCFSWDSVRTDIATTTTVTTAPSGYDQVAFNAFVEGALAGTSYEYGPRGSPSWNSSAQVYQWAAEQICQDLMDGHQEAALRQEKAVSERFDDPVLDLDIPLYVDTIFTAAKTFICPP